jgi:hypothetical protein
LLKPIRKRRIKIIRRKTNSLPAKHAIGNIRANVMSKQKRSLKINYLRPKSACKNKLINIRPMGTSPWSFLILKNQLDRRNLARKEEKEKITRLINYLYSLSSAKNACQAN